MPDKTLDRMGWREKLAHARNARGLTQDQLSDVIDVRQATISAWENGNAFPRLDSLLKATAALRIDPTWLFSAGADEFPSDEERAARAAFEAKIRAVGPHETLALLVGSSSPGEIIGTDDLPHYPKRQQKRADRPRSPAGGSAQGTGLPGSGRGPDEIQLDQTAASKPNDVVSPKRQRK